MKRLLSWAALAVVFSTPAWAVWDMSVAGLLATIDVNGKICPALNPNSGQKYRVALQKLAAEYSPLAIRKLRLTPEYREEYAKELTRLQGSAEEARGSCRMW